MTVSDAGHGKRRVTSVWEHRQRTSSNSTPLLGIQSLRVVRAEQRGVAAPYLAGFGTPYCRSYDAIYCFRWLLNLLATDFFFKF